MGKTYICISHRGKTKKLKKNFFNSFTTHILILEIKHEVTLSIFLVFVNVCVIPCVYLNTCSTNFWGMHID